MKKWSRLWCFVPLCFQALLCVSFVYATPFTVYTAPVPDYMIRTGPTLDQSTGLITEIAAGAFRDAHIKVWMAPEMPWARAQSIAMLTPGAVLLELSRTPAREPHWKWLALTFDEKIFAISLQNHPGYTSIKDMKTRHARVGTRLGSGAASLLQSNGIQVNEAVDTDTSFSQLASGEINVLLIQKFALRPAIEALRKGPHARLLSPMIPQLRYTLLPDDVQQWLVTSRATPAADAQRLGEAMNNFRKSGKYHALIIKYEATVPPLNKAGE